jgi:hypothetical protein
MKFLFLVSEIWHEWLRLHKNVMLIVHHKKQLLWRHKNAFLWLDRGNYVSLLEATVRSGISKKTLGVKGMCMIRLCQCPGSQAWIRWKIFGSSEFLKLYRTQKGAGPKVSFGLSNGRSAHSRVANRLYRQWKWYSTSRRWSMGVSYQHWTLWLFRSDINVDLN